MEYKMRAVSWWIVDREVRVAYFATLDLDRRGENAEADPWIVRWGTHYDDDPEAERQVTGRDAVSVLREAADRAPGRYRDALLAAAADPPSLGR